MCPIFLQRLVVAIDDLEAAMESEDVTCVFSIIHRRGEVCFKIQEAAVESDRKEVER